MATTIQRMGRKPLGKDRINITLPKGMAQQLIDAAAEEGRDRSDLIAELAREYLRRREKAKEGKGKGGGR